MNDLDLTKAEFTAAYGLAAQLPRPQWPEFVFAGRSNVGKSSLINKLAGRKRLAKVSGTPGKTATINFYSVGNAYLVDLPGYGYAKTSNSERSRWDSLINGYFAGRREIRLMLQLLDCRHAPSKDDMRMLEYLRHYQIPFVAVLTKADKLKPSQHTRVLGEFETLLAAYGAPPVVLTSTASGLGMEALAGLMRQGGEGQGDGL